MEFIWRMTEDKWKNMLHDTRISIYGVPSKDYNFYGQMYCEDYCVEFFTDDAGSDGMINFTNIYQLFIDDGYGVEKNGNPYSLTDLCIDIPIANTFEEFKELCEIEFTDGIGTLFDKKYADKKCEWEM